MKEENNNKIAESKVRKLEITSLVVALMGIALFVLIVVFNTRFPNVLFPVFLVGGIVLLIATDGIYLVALLKDLKLVYKRKDYTLSAIVAVALLLFVIYFILSIG